MLSNEQIESKWNFAVDTSTPVNGRTHFKFARAIESAACAERDARIAKLEAENTKLRTVPMKYRRMAFNAELQVKVAELEDRNRDLYEDVQRFKGHAMNEKAARLELERQLEEARKDAERYRWLRDIAGMQERDDVSVYCGNDFDAAIDAAMKGTP
jgi:hypothetical protein